MMKFRCTMTHWTAQDIPNQTGKTALVTGSNSGIGFDTALELARAGATTIVACRSNEKANTTKARILAMVPDAKVETAVFDLMDLNSVANYAEQFCARGIPLDILVNNAGIMMPPERVLTKDGFESQWATNYLATYLLTGKLLPAILKSPNGRIVTVSSMAHRRSKIFFDDLNADRSYNPMTYYGQSKLADAVFGIELQKRLEKNGSKVLSIVAHPGITATELTENSFKTKATFVGYIMKTFIRFGMTSAQGALPSLYAATSPKAKGGKLYGPHSMNGFRGYPVEEKYHKSATADSSIGKKLWDVSEKQTGFSYLSSEL